MGIANNLCLAAAFGVDTLTDNIQAGDDYAAPRLYVEEWLED